MTVHRMMGYHVTDAPSVLEAFLTQAQERYTALEPALDPLKKTVADLEGDWQPRWASYWKAKTADLTSLRSTTQVVLQLFEREQSRQDAPLPLIFSATSLAYTFGLHTVQAKIEEAGILLTAYIEVSDSHQEKHLRQRQRVLKALQDVVKATREAVSEGRLALSKAPQDQQKLLISQPTCKEKLETTPTFPVDELEMTGTSHTLQVVREEVH